MKTLFLKNSISIIFIALGICGAFITTSMQKSNKTNVAYKIGYLRNSNSTKCSAVSVLCSTDLSPFLCRLEVTSGSIAYDKNPATNDCINPLYRPN